MRRMGKRGGWLLCLLALFAVKQTEAIAVDFDMQAETVDLTWQLLGDAGMHKLADKLPRSRCRHLILTKNEVTGKGAEFIANVLAKDHPLVTLDMNGNSIGPDGVAAIVRGSFGAAASACPEIAMDMFVMHNLSNAVNDPLAGIKNHVFIEHLLFPFVTMGDAGAKSLAKGLASHPTVKSLNVMYCNIRVKGAEFLGEMLETNTMLEVLQLDGNKLGDLGAESIAEGLKHNQNLQHIFLGSGNEIADYGAMKLAEALENNKHLQTIGLQGNNIVYIGLEALARTLPSMALETLNLKENNFKSSGASKLFAALEAHPSGLQLLDVSANHIANDAANAIRNYAASNQPLIALDLSFNRLRPGGIAAVLQGLATNTNLQRLDLSGNHVEAAGAIAVAEYIASRGIGDNACGVSNLGLGMSGIGDEGAIAIANALANDNCLKILSLASFNDIGVAGALAIAQMIETNTHLQALDISDNKITAEGCDAIVSALERNHKLQYLNIATNGCTTEAMDAVKAAIARNSQMAEQGPGHVFSSAQEEL